LCAIITHTGAIECLKKNNLLWSLLWNLKRSLSTFKFKRTFKRILGFANVYTWHVHACICALSAQKYIQYRLFDVYFLQRQYPTIW
jgi:hypothetical protein